MENFFISEKIEKFLEAEKLPTPFLVVDLDVVSENYKILKDTFLNSIIYYAVKANSEPLILKRLMNLGSYFDIASIGELKQCFSVGVSPDRISYNNPVKKLDDIKNAYDLGIRNFTFDSKGELSKIAKMAPGSNVFCRFGVRDKGALWPFEGKFGCSSEMLIELMVLASNEGLVPKGISFHVGSQQSVSSRWTSAIEESAKIFEALLIEKIDVKVLNIGGGFPINYKSEVIGVRELSEEISAQLDCCFGSNKPQVFIEPGRFIAGSAGLIRSEVILVAEKEKSACERWVYIDIGRFGGLAETFNEAIIYPIRTKKSKAELGPVILAGPTCDGADVIYKKNLVDLPKNLRDGDYVDFSSAGAYTSSYVAAKFNGLPTITEYYI